MPTASEWNAEGLQCARRRDFAAAAAAFRKAADADENHSGAWNNLGNCLKHLGQLHDAVNALIRAGELSPNEPDAWANLGEVYRLLGQFADARTAYERATAHAPPFHPAWSNRLMHFNYDPTISADELKVEHLNWGQRVPPPPHVAFANKGDPGRPLRLGIVSPDLRDHPVARFLGPILDHLDRQQFSVHLYAELIDEDATGTRFRKQAANWRTTVGQPSLAVAQQIRADGIDILIDLAGHTGHHRLDVFALRAAPVQVTYLGYPNTTGLPMMDAWLTDDVVVTPAYAIGLPEQVVHITGGFSCFEMPNVKPDRRVRSTFSFAAHHTLGKFNDGVLRLWAKVLAASPESRLLVFRHTHTSASAEILRERMSKCGIDVSRVEIRQVPGEPAGYLPHYNDCDLILDTFPFGGHTMTCEALAMGVPVLARIGDTPAGRLSASALTSLGLNEWVAKSDDEYVAIARRLAAHRDRSRTALRQLVIDKLGNGPAFAQEFAAALRELWRLWTNDNRMTTPVASDDPNERGIALARARQFAEAADAFREAIRQAPERASAHFNLALACLRLGKFDEAEQFFERSIRLNPTDAEAHFQLAQMFRQLGRLPDAIVAFRHTTTFAPQRADAWKALGSLLFDTGKTNDAIESFNKAIALAPNDADLHNDLGNALRQLERNEEAAASYRQALAVYPGFGPAHANLGTLLAERGETAEARTAYAAAYVRKKLDSLRILADTALPVIYDSLDQVAEVRARLHADLDRLIADGVRVDPTRELTPTHFYLAYQGLNDRELHEKFARLGDDPRTMQLPPPKNSPGKRIRIGFLSRHLRNHTIGQLNHGLIARLPRDRFEVTVLLAGPAPDDLLGVRIAQQCDRFLRVPASIPDALKQIHELGLDVLYWPDVGMDAQTYALAFSRLAPVQAVTWGHPVTSGLRTVDHFLSSQDLEVAGSEVQYSESLARLDRFAVHYERPIAPLPRERGYYGLPERATLYVCPQTLFKFHPEYDALLGDILRRDPKGRLVLIEGRYPQWNARLANRFQRSIPDVIDRIVWVRKLHREDFLGLIALADVMIDPIHFGGGNTSYEGLALGVPIVSLPSQFLRGRLTYAMYRQMGMTDLVADSPQLYVDLCLRLGTEPDFNLAIRKKIAESAGVLFGDESAVTAFACWVERIARSEPKA